MSIFENPVFYLSDNAIFLTEFFFTVVAGVYLGIMCVSLLSSLVCEFVPKLFAFLKSKFKGGKK